LKKEDKNSNENKNQETKPKNTDNTTSSAKKQ
jgi:hypothetical protein